MTSATSGAVGARKPRAAHAGLEDLYPATGMQLGMLFHNFLDANPAAYVSQLQLELVGAFQPELFQLAWQHLVSRHAIFRTAFTGLDRDQPLQAVMREATLEWTHEDWRAEGEQTQEAHFERFRTVERQRGFDVGRAPLMRMALVRVADDRYRWLWTCHHCVLDGWSVPVVLNEAFSAYAALVRGDPIALPPAARYRDYVAWLMSQDQSAAKAYWAEQLADVAAATALGLESGAVTLESPQGATRKLVIADEPLRSLMSLVQLHGVTLNSIIQAAWSYVLSRYTGADVVVFGQTVSGRPAEVPGIETMVGLFINTLPVRVEVNPTQSIAAWLQSLHRSQAERESYVYLPLVEIQRTSAVPTGEKLFHSLLVFENYPAVHAMPDAVAAGRKELALRAERLTAVEATDFALNLIVERGRELALKLSCHTGQYAGETLERVLQDMRRVLESFADTSLKKVSDLPELGIGTRPSALAELEASLAAHAAVKEVAVVEHDEGKGEQRRIACVVLRGPATAETPALLTQLRAHLRAQSTRHALPDELIVLDALPRTAAGRVDRRALPQLRQARRSFAAPHGVMEELLAGIWCSILKQARVGRDDDFFALGGHSLIATQLMSRIRQAFSVDLPIRVLFENRTLRQQALAIEQLKTAPGESVARIEAAPPNAPLCVSYGQRRLWFLSQLMGSSAVYNMTLALRIDGAADSVALVRALNEIPERHAVLRTRFVNDAGSVLQVLDAHLRAVVVERVSANELERIHRSERAHKFDLSAESLCRIRLLEIAEEGSYALLITMHHIVADGWSLGIVCRELLTLYRAFSRGESSPLAPLPLQYADFAHWQRHGVDAQFWERQLVYWRAQLAGLPPLLTLPTDAPRPARQTYRGSTVRVSLGENLSRQLRSLSSEHGVTLFMTLLSGFAVLLGRYAGQQDVAIGTPIANRTRRETEDLIGLFVNMLVMRTDLKGDPTVAELLKQTRETALQAYAHQDVAFEQVVEHVNPQRNLSHSPLFQAMLDFQQLPAELPAVEGLTLSPLKFAEAPSGEGVSRFDLSLSLAEGPEGLAGTMEYNTDVFQHQTIARLLRHYATLLGAMASSPRERISRLEFLSDEDLHSQLVAWNDTDRSRVSDECLHQLFEDQVRRAPDATAVTLADRHLSYDELNRRANRLAHRLRAQGVGPDVPVGICLERSPALLVAILGVLKASGCYVPLDPDHPRARLGYVLENSGVRLIVTQASLRTSLPLSAADGAGRTVTCELLDGDGESGAGSEADPSCLSAPGNLAYLIYTSGSTGRPKGVRVTHASCANFLRSMREVPGMSSADRVLALTTLSFDIAVLELLLPLSVGATVDIAEQGHILSAEQLTRRMEANCITLCQATPGVWRMLLESGWRGSPDLRALVGGEALPGELARSLLPRVGALWNMYGPTETTIWSTCRRLAPADTSVPIGRPIDNTRAYVLDEWHRPLPLGCVGQLFIGGAGVAQGYHNRPGLTADRFVPDSFSAQRGARLYRTGDDVRYRPQGDLEFVGRSDQQVKVRGFRIELGEVETALLERPDVKQCAVRAHRESQRLVAYVVPREGREEVAREIDMSLFFFAADESRPAPDKYELYLSAARKADTLGLTAIWTPERHCSEVAGLYPNPSVLSAALAMVTQRIALRAGSVVLPLHDPLRVAEEWAVVDNLSRGRVGVAFASGWAPRDFALSRHEFKSRHQAMFDGIRQVQTLWHGGEIHVRDGLDQDTTVKVFPTPVQAQLPVWLTCAVSPQTFEKAGALGLNVLTALLEQSIDEAAEKIALYRRALLANGHDPATRTVTMMLHTFLDPDPQHAIELARGPFTDYMKSHLGLLRTVVKSIGGIPLDLSRAADRDAIAAMAFERYTRGSSLIGSPESCLPLVKRMREIGVDEIACLIDWGIASERVLESLDSIRDLQMLSRSASVATAGSLQLKEYLRTVLPRYMVPDTVMFLEGLPLTANGKLDRSALPEPDATTGRADFSPPEGETEQVLAKLWCALLNVQQIGRDANFFDVGGHSLLAALLTSRIREHLAIELPVRVFFEHQTIREQARAVDRARRGEIPTVAPIERAPRDQFLPLSFEQQQLWIGHGLQTGPGSLYNEHIAWRLSGQLDTRALIRSVETVIARHEILRTRFVQQSEGVAQVIEPQGQPMQMAVVASRQELESLGREERNRRFDLEKAPPCRICLVRDVTDGSHVVLITLHHIVADGWSQTILLRELLAAYRAISAGKEPAFESLPIQYADYAYWQQRRLNDDESQINLAYWRRQLDDVPVLRLPGDRSRVGPPTHIGGQVSFSFAPALLAPLRELTRRTGTTMYMVLLATLHLLLARLTGQDDFVIVSPMSGRMRSETQSLMGVFIGLMPIRLRVARQWSFLELLEHAKTVTLDAQAHQETSFITVDAELRAAGNVGLARLTPVAFNFFNQTPFLEVQTTPEEAPGLTISSLQERAADITVKNDVLFTMREHASGMDGTVVYASDLFDADTISSLVRRYFRLLEQVLAEPEVCVAQIDLSLPSRPLRLDERHIDDMSEEDAQRFLDEIERSGGMRVQP